MNCPSCDKPIEEHETDRKTDRCVAEARGWKIIEKLHNPKLESWQCLSDEQWEAPDDSQWCYLCDPEPYPHFSTSFAACEELIEEMECDEWGIEMTRTGFDSDFKPNKKWHVIIRRREMFATNYMYKSPTLLHAINLAYLAYAGQKGGE